MKRPCRSGASPLPFRILVFAGLLIAALLGAAVVRAAEPVLVEIVRVPAYSEGIVFDHAGYAYISHGKHITQISLTGGSSVLSSIWAETGSPNGHKVLADGTHLVCDRIQHAVLHLDKNGKIIGKASSECEGRPLRTPNDLTLDPQGGFYFTDPGGSAEEPIGTVHYVDRAGTTHLVTAGLRYPNGIVLRPGGKTLLVGESKRNRILEFPVTAQGQVGPMRVFADLPAKSGDQIDNQPDGMALDSEGNLYVAHYGMRQVQVLDRSGKLIRQLPGGNLTTSNVAFAGPKMDQLFITGALGAQDTQGALFRLELPGVRGLRILPAASE
jgi:gluconolactonase